MENQETPQEQENQELDLGIDLTPPPVSQASLPITIDYDAAIGKLKPDAQRIFKALGIKGTGASQEEVEQDLLSKQEALENDLKTNLVPKVQQALQAAFAKTTEGKPAPKAGLPVQASPIEEPRKTRAWRGY